ncbi:MAG: hypothetical protein K1X71_01690 [Pirellulales bacterium]|nr:hypothetical protein [Pirellulales bacterium]
MMIVVPWLLGVGACAGLIWSLLVWNAAGFLVFDPFYLSMRDEVVADGLVFQSLNQRCRIVLLAALGPAWLMCLSWAALAIYEMTAAPKRSQRLRYGVGALLVATFTAAVWSFVIWKASGMLIYDSIRDAFSDVARRDARLAPEINATWRHLVIWAICPAWLMCVAWIVWAKVVWRRTRLPSATLPA